MSVAASSAGGARIRGQLLGGIRRVEDPVPPNLASLAAPAAAGGLLDSHLPRHPIVHCVWLPCPAAAFIVGVLRVGGGLPGERVQSSPILWSC